MVFMSGNGLDNFGKGCLTLTPFIPAEILLAIVNTLALQSIGQKRWCQQLKSRKIVISCISMPVFYGDLLQSNISITSLFIT